MENREQILKRMKSIEGHIAGISRMVERDAYCVDVVHQLLAIRNAVQKVGALVLKQHLQGCVVQALGEKDEREQERVVSEIISIFEVSSRG